MKKVIHLETKVNSVFGVLDEDGNLIRKLQVNPTPEGTDPLSISVLREDAFDLAYEALSKIRSELVDQLKAVEENEASQEVVGGFES